MPTYAMPPSAGGRRHQHTAGRGFDDAQRSEQHDADRSDQRQQVESAQLGRAPAQTHGVAGPRHRRGEDPDVAGVQLECAQHVEAAAAHDDEHAAEGDEAADDGEHAQALAEQQHGQQRNEDRRRRIEQRGVRRGRVAQSPIDRDVLEHGGEQSEETEDLPRATDERPPAAQVREGERGENGERDAPSAEA